MALCFRFLCPSPFNFTIPLPRSNFTSVKAFAPATVTNLNPGIGDTVSLYIDPKVHPGQISISLISGDNNKKLSKNPIFNCAGIAAIEVMKMLSIRSVGLSLHLREGLPLGSGLDHGWIYTQIRKASLR